MSILTREQMNQARFDMFSKHAETITWTSDQFDSLQQSFEDEIQSLIPVFSTLIDTHLGIGITAANKKKIARIILRTLIERGL